MSETIGEIGEDALIRIFAGRALPPDERVIVGNGDDAAVFRSAAGEGVVVTTDTLVEGVHFDLAWSDPKLVGRKLVAVNVSDLAGMGSAPQYAFLSLCASSSTRVEVIEGIAEGLAEHAAEHSLILLGGNTTSTSGPIVLTMTVIGRQLESRILRRGVTRAGDAIFVTGTLGDARAGLWVLKTFGGAADGADERALVAAQNDPTPRVSVGLALSETGFVSSMADISDGLGRDLRRLLAPAGLGATVESTRVPRSPALEAVAAQHGLDAHAIALSGGEDYELLFTAAPEHAPALEALGRDLAVPIHRIGEASDNPEFLVRDASGAQSVLPAGFAHFD